MATFHLHARLMEGGLLAPTRNEVRTRESDDLGEVEALAEQLAARGFAVWIYEHDHGRPLLPTGEGQYRVVAEWSGGAKRLR